MSTLEPASESPADLCFLTKAVASAENPAAMFTVLTVTEHLYYFLMKLYLPCFTYVHIDYGRFLCSGNYELFKPVALEITPMAM